MSAIQPHTVWFERSCFILSQAKGDGLFNPADYGFEFRPEGTAYLNGWYAQYVVDQNQLVLTEVMALFPRLYSMGIQELRRPDTCAESPEHVHRPFTVKCEPPHLPVPFCGAIVVCHGEIPEFFRPYNTLVTHAYEDVLELGFVGGHLVSRIDRSQEMAEIRNDIERGSKPGLYSVGTWLSPQASMFD